MFFEVHVTPKAQKGTETKNVESKKENTRFTLVLAPFQPQTRIQMEALVNTTVQCYLDVKNISNKCLNISITKRPPDERRIELCLSEAEVKGNSCATVCINWSPKEIGCWRDTIQITDSRRVKYDVSVVTVAKALSKIGDKKKTGTRKLPLSKSSSLSASNIRKPVYQENNIIKTSYNNTRKFPSEALHEREHNKENLYKIVENNQYKLNNRNGQKMDRTENENPLDFSKLMDSSSFNLSILNKDHLFTQQVHPQNDTEVRRSTYVKQSNFLQSDCLDFSNKDKIDFLSSHIRIENQSEFSMLVDNLALDSADILISPKQQNCLRNSQEPLKLCTDTDKTFSINSSPAQIDSLDVNGLYEMSAESPVSSKNSTFRTKRLSQNFDNLSPVIAGKCLSYTTHLPSSSPIPTDNLHSRSYDTLKESMIYPTGKHSTSLTAKDVLEADMWAKPIQGNIQNSQFNLETIVEDQCVYVGQSMLELNRTQTLTVTEKKITAVYTEISPPKKITPLRRISPKKHKKVLKDKHAREVGALKKKVQLNVSIKKNASASLPHARITKLSLSGIGNFKKKDAEENISQTIETSVKLHDPDEYLTHLWNLDPFVVTEDPFLTTAIYYDDRWIHNQELMFKKWLNTLMSPPEESNTSVDTALVDVGKVWQSCKMKADTILAETKEAVSARYHTHVRLNTLRKAACAMLRRKEVAHVLSKTTFCIEKGILTIRLDRDLHKDIGLQKTVLELFLSYNPLWLRIGLEAVYGETIPLQSNSDLVGLTRFLLNRFFTDPYLTKVHAHAYFKNKEYVTFITQLNKFMLKKFLVLVYFLDYAKNQKLIGHDPCLFHKRAVNKDSRSILLTFSREVLSGVGDVTKVLRGYDYVVTHKQTYLDEFDYAVKDLSTDLRDGVRLCRVMELITGRRNLTAFCRVPAISRLQKIHNADVALKALIGMGYTITGNIDAKSIVDGHKEKTLSLLWQIVYKYQAPRYEKNACTLQKWWRAMLWYVRVRNFLRMRKHHAACVIQRAWRCKVARGRAAVLRIERMRELKKKHDAARIIQIHWRHVCRGKRDFLRFQQIKHATGNLQRWWRRIRACKPYIEDLQRKQIAVINIQRWLRSTKLMVRERDAYLKLRQATILLQSRWRATLLMKVKRIEYMRLWYATVFIQSKWRGTRLMQKQKRQYLEQLRSIKMIQTWWKGILIGKRDRNNFLIVKDAARTIERWWLSIVERKNFEITRQAATVIQARWRGRKQRMDYLRKKSAVLRIQSWYHCSKLSMTARKKFLQIKCSTILIQHWWRAVIAAKVERHGFLDLRNATLLVQRQWRAILITRRVRKDYLLKRHAVISIQAWWRMIRYRRLYVSLMKKRNAAAVNIQRRWRALIIGRTERKEYLQTVKAASVIQVYWKYFCIARNECNKFRTLKLHTIRMQRLYRANKIAHFTRQQYINLRCTAITIQRTWRSRQFKRRLEYYFTKRTQAAILIQSCWRMKREQKKYIVKRQATLTIQLYWRAHVTRNLTRAYYVSLKKATLFVQRRYRENRLCKIAEAKRIVQHLRAQRSAATRIQRWWKYVAAARRQKIIEFYKKWREGQDLSPISVQETYRYYSNAAVVIQGWWRRLHAERVAYERMYNAVAIIEDWWKNVLKHRKKSRAATLIQAVWRAHKVRQNETDRMSEVRRRCKAATKAAQPTATLAYRWQEAINILRNHNCSIGQLSICLISLDTIMKLIPNVSITLCEYDLADKIYDMLDLSNRSLPWIYVCIRTSSILITLAKYPPTKCYVHKAERAETILRLLKASLEYKELFLHLATLLWLLMQDKEYEKTVAACPRTTWLLKTLHTKVVNKKYKAVNSEKLKNDINLPPSCKPDWELKQREPRLFNDIRYAVATIMKQIDGQ